MIFFKRFAIGRDLGLTRKALVQKLHSSSIGLRDSVDPAAHLVDEAWGPRDRGGLRVRQHYPR